MSKDICPTCGGKCEAGYLPGTPNTKLDNLMELLRPNHISSASQLLNDEQAKQAINDYYYQEFIDLIGPDEKPSPTALRGVIWADAKNSLRAELRAQAKIRFGSK